MGEGDGGGVDYGSSVDDGGSVDDGRSVDDGGGVVRWGIVGSRVVHGRVVADDALGGHRAVVQRQEASAGGSQHGAEGEHLYTENIFKITLLTFKC